MKIKVNKKAKAKTKKFLSRGIKIPKTVRLMLIGTLVLLLLLSLVFFYNSYQKPTYTEKTITTLSYTQQGRYDYTASLVNNTVYGGKTSLRAGEGVIFSQLVKNITGSFTYTLSVSKDAEISGIYSLKANLISDSWNRSFNLVPSNPFEIDGGSKSASVSFDFPIDLDYYETVISDIDSETGVSTQNPNLKLEANVIVNFKTNAESMSKSFNHNLEIPIGKKIIDIDNSLLSSTSTEVKTARQEEYQPEVEQERNKWRNLSILFFVLFLVTVLVTRSKTRPLSDVEKQVKKILKKNGEWIVEIEKTPKMVLGKEIVQMKSIDDLLKASEELGKPILYHFSKKDNRHLFMLIDEDIYYEYSLS